MASDPRYVDTNTDITSKPTAHHTYDGEKYPVDHAAGETQQLQRRLKSRHLQMIAIGGTIGTGLFIGTGGALAAAGPAGILIAWIFVGSLVLSVMVALGEMATFLPVPGAFSVYAARFVDPSLGFSMGWIYQFSWCITYALELTVAGLLIQYWRPDLSIAIFVGVFWAIISALNMLPVSFYGELEFWFASIKVLTVTGFLIFGICINAGAGQQGYLGFRYWNEPGAFNASDLVADNVPLGRFVAFWSVIITAGFSYQGTELVGIAAGEAGNPRKTVPSAIKKTFWRILFFFIFTVFFIGILIPSDNDRLGGDGYAASSPFVIAADLAGVPVLPSLLNAVLITVVLSAANSNVYSGSRILVGLANERCAPAIFTRSTASGVPWVAVIYTSAFGLLGFLNLTDSGSNVFNWFLNITGVAGFIAWTCIGISHLCFMRILRVRGISRDSLPYKAPFQPWLSYYGVVFNIIIIFTQGFTAFVPFDVTAFFIAYVSLILFAVLYIGHKVVFRQPFVDSHLADIDTGRMELDGSGPDGIEYASEPRTWKQKAIGMFT